MYGKGTQPCHCASAVFPKGSNLPVNHNDSRMCVNLAMHTWAPGYGYPGTRVLEYRYRVLDESKKKSSGCKISAKHPSKATVHASCDISFITGTQYSVSIRKLTVFACSPKYGEGRRLDG
eukprot:2420365-Rhodomonas_salina.1